MTAVPPRAARFRLAPVDQQGADWDRSADLVLTPLRLASPVPIVLALLRGRSPR